MNRLELEDAIAIVKEAIGERQDVYPGKSKDKYTVTGLLAHFDDEFDAIPFSIFTHDTANVKFGFVLVENVSYCCFSLIQQIIQRINPLIGGKLIFDENDKIVYSRSLHLYSRERAVEAVNKTIDDAIKEITVHIDLLRKVAKQDYSEILNAYFSDSPDLGTLKRKIYNFNSW